MSATRYDADGKVRRGTSNTNARGNAEQRRRRKVWLLETFGDGETVPCAFECGRMLTLATITVDRFPIPGCDGGTYRRGNIRAACGTCNYSHGGSVRSEKSDA